MSKPMSPRNKVMSLTLHASNYTIDSEEHEYSTTDITNVIKLVYNNNYHIDKIPEIRRIKKKSQTKKINLASNDLLQYVGLSEDEYELQKQQSAMNISPSHTED